MIAKETIEALKCPVEDKAISRIDKELVRIESILDKARTELFTLEEESMMTYKERKNQKKKNRRLEQ